MKNPIKGALNQLSTKANPLGLVEHYLWGFEGPYDSRVWITEETYERIRSFLLEGSGDELRDIDGLMASDSADEGIVLGDSRDGESIPFGTRVSVILWMEDRHSEESAWFFDIRRADGTR